MVDSAGLVVELCTEMLDNAQPSRFELQARVRSCEGKRHAAPGQGGEAAEWQYCAATERTGQPAHEHFM
jgi:hypothetical protein